MNEEEVRNFKRKVTRQGSVGLNREQQLLLIEEVERLRQLLHNWSLNPDSIPVYMPKSLASFKKEPY